MPKLPITDVVSIYQQQRAGNTESYQSTPTYTSVNVCISPTGTDIQPDYGDVAAFQLFEIFLYDATLILHNADKIVTANGTAYILDGKPFVVNNLGLSYIRVLGKQIA